MEQLIAPSNTTLGMLFKENTSYIIPNYQRNYSWTTTNVQQFWDDIFYCVMQRKENKPYQHYFGQILCFSRGKDTNNLEKFELIDGQQRITTLTLLITAIAKKCKQIETEPTTPSEIKVEAKKIHENIYKSFLFYTPFEPIVQRLKIQQKDLLFLQALINAHINNSADCTEPKTSSQKLLKSALSFFNESLCQLNYSNHQYIELFNTILKSLEEDCILIELSVKSHIGVQHLFTTVNDRGLCLTTGELLKAKVIETFKDFDNYQDEAEEIWNTILSDDAKTAEIYLEYYYISNCGRVDSNKGLYHSYIDNFLILCNERSIDKNNADILMEQIRQLDSGIQIIEEIANGNWPYPIKSNSPCPWKRNRLKVLVKGLGCKSVIPMLVSAKTFLTEEVFYKILSYAELNYFNVVSVNSPNRYTKFTDVVYKEAVKIRNEQTKYKAANTKDAFLDFRKKNGYDTDFINKLKELSYKPKNSNPTSRYFLYMMEIYYNSFSSSGYTAPDDSLTIDFDTLSTEHIYSYSLDKSKIDKTLEPYKNFIGNLCPLGKSFNSRLGNKTFIEKLPKYKAAGYKITNDISKKTSWEKKDYEELTKKYLLIAEKLFINNLGI